MSCQVEAERGSRQDGLGHAGANVILSTSSEVILAPTRQPSSRYCSQEGQVYMSRPTTMSSHMASSRSAQTWPRQAKPTPGRRRRRERAWRCRIIAAREVRGPALDSRQVIRRSTRMASSRRSGSPSRASGVLFDVDGDEMVAGLPGDHFGLPMPGPTRS